MSEENEKEICEDCKYRQYKKRLDKSCMRGVLKEKNDKVVLCVNYMKEA